MNFIFVDTNAWIALNSKRDHWHKRAVEINKQLLKKGFRYLTTSYVLDESYTGLRIKVAHNVVVDFGERIQTSRLVQVIHIDEDIENLAWELFKQYTKTVIFWESSSENDFRIVFFEMRPIKNIKHKCQLKLT